MYILYRLGDGKKQSDGQMARYNCAGTEQNLNDCRGFSVTTSVCTPPASSIVACSKSYGLEMVSVHLFANIN